MLIHPKSLPVRQPK